MRVAVVGAGVSGLAAAHELVTSGGVNVMAYEKEDCLGGSPARRVAVNGDAGGELVHLDLSFMVFNSVACPNMMQWFDVLGANMERSEMYFSVRMQWDFGGACDWASGNGISGLLAYKSKRNGISGFCLRVMLSGTWRIVKTTLIWTRTRLLDNLSSHMDIVSSYKKLILFQSVVAFGLVHHNKFWASPLSLCYHFSISITFFSYLVMVSSSVSRVILSLISTSDIYLHCDESFMPRNSSAWSACNFMCTRSRCFCVMYWLNLAQNIESTRTFLVTLNPTHVPNHVLLKWNTSHLAPSVAASKASFELDQIQGRVIWFCGTYQGCGFHEDGLKAGKASAQSLLGKKIGPGPLVNPKQMVLSWTETSAHLLVSRFLNQYISVGNLILFEEGGTMFSFGEACCYINGCFSFINKREGLLNVFLILIANREHKSSSRISNRRGWWTPLLLTAGVASAKYFLPHISRKNTVTQTRQNISQHYDLSNDFFSIFLDKSMTYSHFQG